MDEIQLNPNAIPIPILIFTGSPLENRPCSWSIFQSQAHWLLISSMGKNDRAGVSGCSTFTRIHVGFEL